jgi:hypothetical protein
LQHAPKKVSTITIISKIKIQKRQKNKMRNKKGEKGGRAIFLAISDKLPTRAITNNGLECLGT